MRRDDEVLEEYLRAFKAPDLPVEIVHRAHAHVRARRRRLTVAAACSGVLAVTASVLVVMFAVPLGPARQEPVSPGFQSVMEPPASALVEHDALMSAYSKGGLKGLGLQLDLAGQHFCPVVGKWAASTL